MKMAVVGLGHFAQSAILPALESMESVAIAALVSGTPHKLAELGPRYGVPVERCVDYGGLDALLASGEIDAVYIAVPNDGHCELVLTAARHRVHALCEKPMAPTEAEADRMREACDAAGVALMIAYRLHFETANLTAIDILTRGEIGVPRAISSLFAQQVTEGNSRTQPRAGAGPIYDIGIYCINAARYLFRAEPIEVFGSELMGSEPRFSSNGEAFAATLRFTDDRVAQFTCSFGAAKESRYEVIGTKGNLVLENAYDYAGGKTMHVTTERGTRTNEFGKRDQIAAEVEYFASCVRTGVRPEPGPVEGTADIRIIEALLRSARTGRVVPIEPVAKRQRPGLEQELYRAPHGEPPLVDVDAPTRR